MDIKRPYLVIPKLIEQPTWGGDYIVKAKSWSLRKDLQDRKIGQAYELFHESNLSLLHNSADPKFTGEITTSSSADKITSVPNSLKLAEFLKISPIEVLGSDMVKKFGPKMPLLIKFTQSLGNSFQIHIKDGTYNTFWQSKPESWYFFEPGLLTLGVKSGIDWNKYEAAVTELQDQIMEISLSVQDGKMNHADAKKKIEQLIQKYNPLQYVNLVYPEKDAIIDLSECGLHHSWEEDAKKFPSGNVVYEVQLNVMDGISTIRSFDKGKMAADGSVRPLYVDDYFEFIDRSGRTNNPKSHILESKSVAKTKSYSHDRLLQTKYYTLDRVNLFGKSAKLAQNFKSFRHVFIKEGEVELESGSTKLHLTQGHSAFVPAACGNFVIKNLISKPTTVLITY